MGKGLKPMIEAFGSDKAFKIHADAIKEIPHVKDGLAHSAGLDLVPREEYMISTLQNNFLYWVKWFVHLTVLTLHI